MSKHGRTTKTQTRLFTAPIVRRRPAVPFTITNANLSPIIWGLGFTASGGGGALMDGITLAEDLISKGFTSLLAADTLTAPVDQYAVMPGGMGAPSAIAGSILDFIPACQAAIDVLAASGAVPGPIVGLTPVEAGPVNGMLPIYVAYLSNGAYTLYNCDGAGRAVPSLTNLLFDYEPDLTFSPAGVANIDGTQSQVIPGLANGAEAEEALRGVIADYGGAIGLAAWSQGGLKLRSAELNLTTYSDAATLGGLFRSFSNSAAVLTSVIQTFLPGAEYQRLVWNTTLSHIYRDPAGLEQGYDKGFYAFGRNTIEPGMEYRLYYLNENMFISRHRSTGDPNDPSADTFVSYVATAPSIIGAFYSDPNPPAFLEIPPAPPTDNMVPYNTGDNDLIATLVGRPMVVAVRPPAAAKMYSPEVMESFVDVLNAYFNDYGFNFTMDDLYPKAPA